jgi:hypothetical protein
MEAALSAPIPFDSTMKSSFTLLTTLLLAPLAASA